ncbi:GtrA-like protein [Oxobacter pfennigii]|uniref:GtrA-like protein n=1 Tax=Oxobacter pfennigii TaxID=36849 RepID=A0A0P8W2R2_9CLOT|nr:GtrA family protein [Oxobacter pfennigii]KPU42809.1 GtrA-like protein [Oxobacter pfennigii]
MLKIAQINLGKYFMISCFASILDFSLAYFLYKVIGINYIISSNFGLITGFVFQYFAGMKYVFQTNRDIHSFIIYMATFAMGVFIANSTLWLGFDVMELSFIISKTLSMGMPFFITYFIRKRFLR